MTAACRCGGVKSDWRVRECWECRTKRTPIEKVLRQLDGYPVPDACWLWTGRLDRNGYGRVSIDSTSRTVHRVAYAHFVGPIPADLELDHLCRVRRCANPRHLELVTTRENVLRSMNPAGLNARKTHCLRGHLLPPRGSARRRLCRSCIQIRLEVPEQGIGISSQRTNATRGASDGRSRTAEPSGTSSPPRRSVESGSPRPGSGPTPSAGSTAGDGV